MQRAFIRNVAKGISRLVLGTDTLASKYFGLKFPYGKGGSTLRFLDEVFASGINAFDTARSYGMRGIYGRAEIILGEWMKTRRTREEAVVITKGGPLPLDAKSDPLQADALLSHIDGSLRRLQIDRIDLFLVHYDRPAVPVEVAVDALDRAQSAGKIAAYGFSNWSVARVREAITYARQAGKHEAVAVSPQYSLMVWTRPLWNGAISISGPDERGAREWLAGQDLGIFAYSSLGRGFFREARQHPAPARPLVSNVFDSPENGRRYREACRIAAGRSVSPSQVALAYLFVQGMNVFAITGATSLEKIRENARATTLQLTQSEIAALDGESSRPRR